MSKGSGAAFGNRLSSSTEPASGLGPSGFDPARGVCRGPSGGTWGPSGGEAKPLRRIISEESVLRAMPSGWFRLRQLSDKFGLKNAYPLRTHMGRLRARGLVEDRLNSGFLEWRATRDRDGAEGGDANAAPVPQDRQARAEGIAQNPEPKQ